MSAGPPPARKKLQWRLEGLAYLAAERLLTLVPLPVLWRAGAALSGWSRLVPSRRRIVRRNLRTVLAHVSHKPSGCGFRTRCPKAIPECALETPPLEEKMPGHYVACIRVDKKG